MILSGISKNNSEVQEIHKANACPNHTQISINFAPKFGLCQPYRARDKRQL